MEETQGHLEPSASELLAKYLRRPSVLLPLLALVTFVIYSGSLSFDFVWDDVWVVQEGGGEQNLLSHALRIRGERRMAVIPERKCPKELVHLGFQDAAGHAAKPAHQLQVLPAGEMRVEVGLLRNAADPDR